VAQTKKTTNDRTTAQTNQTRQRLREVYGDFEVVTELIGPNDLSVLPQPRKTFEDIDELAGAIASSRQLAPIQVARFSQDQFEVYLGVINGIWGTNIQSSQFTTKHSTPYYYVLLAGERRTRAMRVICGEGCPKCREEGRVKPGGGCFHNHPRINNGCLRADVYLGIHPFMAQDIQFSENIHAKVPSEQEARAYFYYWRLNRQHDEKTTIAEFARRMGRSPEKISGAIRYCELPEKITWYVEQEPPLIPYTMALELSKIQRYWAENEKPVDVEYLDRLVINAIIHRLTVVDVKQRVKYEIDNWRSGQRSLDELFDEAAIELERKLTRKRTVEKEIIHAIVIYRRYVKTILRLFDKGLLGPDEAPYSCGGPINQLRELMDIIRQALIRLRHHNRLKQSEVEEHLRLVASMERELEVAARHGQ